MANIYIQGKEYNNVPSVTFNKVGGGTATYTENGSSTTIVRLDVDASGTYTAPTGTAYSPVVVPSGSAQTPITVITADPTISVNSSGLITASVEASQSVTPTVVSGYVTSGSSGTVSAIGSKTSQLPTQGATTITPTTSSQTAVASGKYTTGAITVDPIPSQYIIPTGTVNIVSNGTVDVSQYASADVAVPATPTSYLGTNPVKIADYTGEKVYLSSTAFTTWAPSTTALVLSTTANAGTAVLDLANYDYCIIWTSESVFTYNASAANTSKTIKQSHSIYQGIYKSPNGLTALVNKNYNANRCTNLFSGGVIEYYNQNSAHTMTYTVSTAMYPTSTAATFSHSTSDTPTMTVKTPVFRIVCNNTYLSAATAGNIDASNTYYKYWGELWRVDKDSTIFGMYKNIVNAYND